MQRLAVRISRTNLMYSIRDIEALKALAEGEKVDHRGILALVDGLVHI